MSETDTTRDGTPASLDRLRTHREALEAIAASDDAGAPVARLILARLDGELPFSETGIEIEIEIETE